MKDVVIIGGGFGGLSIAKMLINKDYHVTLIDRKNHHLFQPLLYQVASAALSPSEIAAPLREVLRKGKNIDVILDEVVTIDKEKRVIYCKYRQNISYDKLIIAAGSEPFYYGNDQWKEHAIGLKDLKDALSIRDRMLKAFEEGERDNKESLNFVIVGAGPTGVELAGAFAEIAYEILKSEFHYFDLKKTKVYLIEGGENILPAYGGKLSLAAKSLLEELGVEVILGHRVLEINERGVKLSNMFIESSNIVWAAGNRASPLIKKLNIPIDNLGRAMVNYYLNPQGHDDIYIVGDCANFIQEGNVLPSLAPVASQQGKHVAKQLLKNKKIPFRYLDKGTMATIGKNKAVMDFHGIRISGFVAWLSWCLVHVLFLIKFSNKLFVFMKWTLAYFSNRKLVRLIIEKEDDCRSDSSSFIS